MSSSRYLTLEQRGELLGGVRVAAAGLRAASEGTSNRALALAITKLDEAIHWLEDPTILEPLNATDNRS